MAWIIIWQYEKKVTRKETKEIQETQSTKETLWNWQIVHMFSINPVELQFSLRPTASFIKVPFSLLQNQISLSWALLKLHFVSGSLTCCRTISQFKPIYAWHEAFFYFFFIYLSQMRCPFFLEGSGCCATTPQLKSTRSKIIPTGVVKWVCSSADGSPSLQPPRPLWGRRVG